MLISKVAFSEKSSQRTNSLRSLRDEKNSMFVSYNSKENA